MKLLRKITLLASYCFLVSVGAKAQQMAGGELTYKCLNAATKSYTVTLVLYAKCPNPLLPSSPNIKYYSNSVNQTFPQVSLTLAGQETIISCPGNTIKCNGGTGEYSDALIKRTYTGNISLPSAQKDWVVEYNGNNRTLDLTTISTAGSGPAMYLAATINNTASCISSVSFGGSPIGFVNSGQASSYDPLITNTAGGQVRASLITPKITPSSSVSYKSPFSANQPISTSGAFAIDGATGKINFTPSTQGEVSVVTMQVEQVSNGTVIGSAMREMYIQTLSPVTNPPAFVTQGDTVYSCVNDALKSITGQGASGNVVDIIWNNKADWGVTALDSGRKYTVAKGQTATFSLVTSAFPGAFTRTLNLTLVDNKCGKTTKSFVMKVSNKPTITTQSNTVTDLLCLKPTEIKVDVTGGKPPYTYLWSPNGETTNPITVNSVGTFSVIATDANQCSTARWFKTLRSPINFAIGRISCVDSMIKFYDISRITNNPNYVPPPAAPQATTAHWTWEFNDGTQVDTTHIQTAHKFAKAGTYTVKMSVSDGKGCNNSISKRIKVYDKTLVDFTFKDTCQVTEPSDLTVNASIPVDLPYDTTVTSIRFSVDGAFRLNGAIGDNRLREPNAGEHTVFMQARNAAGCVTELTKKAKVRDRPRFLPTLTRDSYFYKCNSPGFPDTTFAFVGTAAGQTLIENKNLIATITKISGSGFVNVVSGDTIKVPHKITEHIDERITVTIMDKYGCKNDTIVDILNPVKPNISLAKYYCFQADTLKLTDLGYTSNDYHWGLAKAAWDMKDGFVDTTLGKVAHSYTLTALDEALVSLNVEDKMNCKATDTLRVYLSEPNPSQFRLSDSMACVAHPVTVFGIKNNYINSWYYRYKDQPESIFTTPDSPPVINTTFGDTVPSTGIDNSVNYTSNRYVATTGIFYNEKDPNRNFQLSPKVCSLTVSKKWKVIDRLDYAISNDYDHCYDSLKVFKASPTTSVSTVKLKDSSWVWSLYSPQNILKDTLRLANQSVIEYNPSTALFTDVATTRVLYNSKGQYLPYSVTANYSYTNDTITCPATTPSLKVANEKVDISIDDTKINTCAYYTNNYYLNRSVFYELIEEGGKTYEEKDSTVWDYGNGSTGKGYPGSVRYDTPGEYRIIGYATNYYGCKDSVSTKVIVAASPQALLKVDTVCYGVENTVNGASISVTGISKYYWYYFLDSVPVNNNIPDTTLATKVTSDSVFKELFSVGNTKIGLAVQDDNTCWSVSDVKDVVVNPIPSNTDFTALAVATNDQDYLGNEPISFAPDADPTVTKREWKMGDGNSFLTKNSKGDTIYTYPYYAPPYPIEKNMYNVTYKVETAGGCIDSVTKRIDVNAYFVLPNAFSPNEDGMHDQLISVGKGIKEIKEFKIFNRWGEEVYSVTGKPEKDAMKRGYLLWDGKYNGQVQPVGAYVYYAVVTTGYGNEIIKKGNLSLLR